MQYPKSSFTINQREEDLLVDLGSAGSNEGVVRGLYSMRGREKKKKKFGILRVCYT